MNYRVNSQVNRQQDMKFAGAFTSVFGVIFLWFAENFSKFLHVVYGSNVSRLRASRLQFCLYCTGI